MREIKTRLPYPIFMSGRLPVAQNNQLMTVKNLTDQSADLYIYGEIVDNTDWKWDETDVMPNDVLDALNKIKDVGNLNIYINSPGGSVFSGMAIYNILNRHKAKKTVYVDGVAASMASVIALVGDEVFIPSNAFLMIHQPWTIAMGNAKEFRKVADDLDAISTGVLNVYKERLKDGVDFETVKQMVDDETWLNGEEASRYFNIKVTEAKNIAACASDILERYDKTPQKLFGKKEPQQQDPPIQDKDLEKLKIQNELDLLML